MTDKPTSPDRSSSKTFPLVDYHVHLTEQFTIDVAVALAQERGVKFGIVQHPGPQFGLATDQDLERYIAIYANIRFTWACSLSTGVGPNDFPRLLDELDYVLMDADTVPLGGDRYLEIWRHNNYIADVDDFMRLYMAHIEGILRYEPSPFLPGRPTCRSTLAGTMIHCGQANE